MARFYANIQGNRGGASRMGTPSSGIYGHIRGWRSGGRVSCYVNRDDKDVVEIWATTGSAGYTGVNGLIVRLIDGEVDYLTTKKKLLQK